MERAIYPAPISNVPDHKVGKLVQAFVDSGARELKLEIQDDGSWIVTQVR
jgi:hypothetical protein